MFIYLYISYIQTYLANGLTRFFHFTLNRNSVRSRRKDDLQDRFLYQKAAEQYLKPGQTKRDGGDFEIVKSIAIKGFETEAEEAARSSQGNSRSLNGELILPGHGAPPTDSDCRRPRSVSCPSAKSKAAPSQN